MYDECEKLKEEETLIRSLKDQFHKDFISSAPSWKTKMLTFNDILKDFCQEQDVKFPPYRYNAFCRVCYYAISEVIDSTVDFYSVYPTENEAFALEDSLIATGQYTEDRYIELLVTKREDKFVSLQQRLSNEMSARMMEFLANDKLLSLSDDFLKFIKN